MQCIADLCAIMTALPPGWCACGCATCKPAAETVIDRKSAAANDKGDNDDEAFTFSDIDERVRM